MTNSSFKFIFFIFSDIPKFLTNHTIYYSWEGNPVNISCDVMSNPPATMLWRRERFTISEGTQHMQIYRTDEKSVLEVGMEALKGQSLTSQICHTSSFEADFKTELWLDHSKMLFLEIPRWSCYKRFCLLIFQVTPMSDRDFGRYNCTARNNIGVRYQEFILAQAGERKRERDILKKMFIYTSIFNIFCPSVSLFVISCCCCWKFPSMGQ